MEKETLLVNTLHTLLCDNKHEGDMQRFIKGESNCCNFYLEESVTDFWELPDHKYWAEEAERIRTNLRASSAQEALRSIYKVLDLIEKTNELADEEFDLFTNLLQLSSSSEDPS